MKPQQYANTFPQPAEAFTLDFAPHLGMFRESAGEDPLEQLRFMADAGFRSFEDNGMGNRPVAQQEAMARLMAERDMRMGVFVAHTIYWDRPNLASGDLALREEFLGEIRAAVAVAQRVNARWMTVVPGHLDLRQDMGHQTAHVVESLRRAADILEPHNLTMVLEPLNFRNHPGMFLSGSAQAYEICRAVNSPACKILFDIYHQQIQEGNLIPNIEACWDEIAYFQIGDNPGRKEPTTGEINYSNVFKYIAGRGYEGILGMEHGNSQEGISGEKAVIEAYRAVDP
ncbi:hydroxypyruvate isomerase family protein [Robiginitalea biformata]|uniref:Probable glyoxylate-induced protein n=1 Tax=Robiginitalea biformata (strain ATCC BAA-864 / DSM 15991 / KCTC 12146 / HTCC2501) TaxID=313596 RepID=A4CHH1_ROBBH|nr:TIM barrel protein [Robiginitalea biformata]EAR16379.1 probable glyoxylate-induced protein [Robiginitalea biformata HTCC2501]